MEFSNCGTIRTVHRLLLAKGYPISEHSLRVWIKEGRIPAVYSGKRAYITFENVLRFLKCVDVPFPAAAPAHPEQEADTPQDTGA